MRVIIDSHAGFCPGVKRAVALVEERLAAGKKITALGALIHNDREIGRLQDKGLCTVPQNLAEDDRTLHALAGQEVLVRTHGVGMAVAQRLHENGVIAVDGTCPTVARVQRSVAEYHHKGYQIVIIGKKDHAEVIGLSGHCDHRGVVIESREDITRIDPKRPTLVVAQTTIGAEKFAALSAEVAASHKDAQILDTTCRFISRRYDQVRTFAAAVDVLIFVGGRESSNSRVLFEICQQNNPRSHKIESPQELMACWFDRADVVGISGGASTPVWQFEEVRQLILTLP